MNQQTLFSANIEAEEEDGRKSRVAKRPNDKIKRKRKIKFEDEPISDRSETKSEPNSLDNLDETSDRTRLGFCRSISSKTARSFYLCFCQFFLLMFISAYISKCLHAENSKNLESLDF